MLNSIRVRVWGIGTSLTCATLTLVLLIDLVRFDATPKNTRLLVPLLPLALHLSEGLGILDEIHGFDIDWATEPPPVHGLLVRSEQLRVLLILVLLA